MSATAQSLALPSGVVTFLFTDIQDSTRLWEQGAGAMREALERHDQIVRGGIERHGGHVFATGGDAFCAAFQRATDAVSATVAIQLALGAEQWEPGPTVRVRMGLHTGETFERGGDYFGPTVNRAARLMGLARGGQIVCSALTAGLVRPLLPAGVTVDELESVRLKGLSDPELVHGIVAEGLDTNFGALGGVAGVIGNLPLTITRLIGRATDIDAITSRLVEHRLVTLTGPGGVGKTSIAQAAAAAVMDKFPDGVWWVDLAARSQPDEVPWAVAESLGVQETQPSKVMDAVTVAMAGRRLLVVIDNAEHLADATRRAVGSLLREDNELVVLVTSRERLGLAVEHDVAVAPLEFTSLDSSAPALFIERAGRPELAEGDDGATVLELCRRLDGLPLAIELAAARCRSLAPRAVLDRLGTGLRLLSNQRGQDPRQATMEATIRWSYDLLEPRDQAVINRLSVFASTFDLEAAEQICGYGGLDEFDVDDALSSLVDKSLVTRERERYRLLESTRMFARTRLDESGDTSTALARLVAWATQLAEATWHGARSADDLYWRDRTDLEWPNYTVAFEHTLTLAEADACAELYRWLRDITFTWKPECASWAEMGLAAFPEATGAARRSLLAGRALESMTFSLDPEVALSAAAECWSDEDPEPSPRWPAGLTTGLAHLAAGDFEAGSSSFWSILDERMLERDGNWTATVLFFCLAFRHVLGDPGGQATVVIDPETASFSGCTAQAFQQAAIAVVRAGQGDLAAAHRCAESAVELCRRIRNPLGALTMESTLLMFLGAPPLRYSVVRFDESLRQGMLPAATSWLSAMAGGLAAAGEHRLASLVLAVARNHTAAIVPDIEAAATGALSPEELEAITDEARHIPLNELAKVVSRFAQQAAPSTPTT